MPSKITKKGRTRWRACVRVTTPDGRKLQQQRLFGGTAADRREATMWEDRTRAEMVRAIHAPADTICGLDAWAIAYLDHVQATQSLAAYREKRTAFQLLIRQNGFPEDAGMDVLTVPLAFRHLQRQAQERSGNAANKDRKNLSAAWDWGKKYLEGFPQHAPNPCRAVDRFPEDRAPRYIPPEEDFWRVYEAAEGQDQLILLAALHLAARKGELWGLTWPDLDFGEVRVRLWTRKRRGGSREYDWLPMTRELKAALLGWREERLTMRTVDRNAVFVCLSGASVNGEHRGKPFHRRGRWMPALCRSVGVEPFGMHAIRHLSASILFRMGCDVAHIQAVLRHRNPNTTTRYLRSLGLEDVRESLNDHLGGRAKVLPFHAKGLGDEIAGAFGVSGGVSRIPRAAPEVAK